MPVNPALLGPQLGIAAGSTDPVGIAAWMSIAAAFTSWVPTCTINPLGGTPLVAVGPVITGTGAIVPGPPPALGLALAAASMSTDAAGIAKWMAIAVQICSWMSTAGGINPVTLVAYASPIPPTGPVAGVAMLAFTAPPGLPPVVVDPTDATGTATWTAIGAAIQSHLSTLALVTPAFINPGVGGPVTGTGTIS